MVRKQKEDLGYYITDILKNSMFTGIPQIISARNTSKKIIRILVLIACLIGFVYQSLVFLNLYWQYKTVVDVQTKETKTADLPSITVCNLLGVQRTKICNDSRYASKCVTVADSPKDGFYWCECLGERWCKNGVLKDNIMVGSWTLYGNLASMEYKKTEMLLQELDQFLTYCSLTHGYDETFFVDCTKQEYYQHIKCTTKYENPSCYTLNTIIGRPDTKIKKILTTGILSLKLAPHPEEYNTLLRRVKVHISIHNPRQIVNALTTGFTMGVNKRYDFQLRKVVKKLLPPPYETNCVDYIEKWKARGGYGPTNEKECKDECKKNVSMLVFGCIFSHYEAVTNDRRCGVEFSRPTAEMIKRISDCEENNCHPACYDETYGVKTETGEFSDKVDTNKQRIEDASVLVKIHMNGMQTTTYTYSPKYQSIETFSYLGGYVGMWLGISLVAVFDFFETIIIMLKYSIKKYHMKRKARKGRVMQVGDLQRDV